MKRIAKAVLMGVILLGGVFVSFGWALMITEPKTGAIFHPGDKVLVKVRADTGEVFPRGIFIRSYKNVGSTIDVVPPYELEMTIAPTFMGVDTIAATGELLSGELVEAERITLTVLLPSTTVLQGIAVDPKRMSLRKLPDGSDPNRVRFAETERIAVMGNFSDGVEREVSYFEGTTYQTSDPLVATVDVKGLVTAVAPGRVNITVKNGNHQIQVSVVVSAKK